MPWTSESCGSDRPNSTSKSLCATSMSMSKAWRGTTHRGEGQAPSMPLTQKQWGWADFHPISSQKGASGPRSAARSYSPSHPGKPQLKPYPSSLLLAGEEKPGGSHCAWYIIKNTGNLTIKPARFLALIPDQRGFGKEHPRFECLSQPDAMSF